MEAITNTSDHSNKNYFESAAVSSYVWEMKMKQNETPSLTGNAKISFAIFQQNKTMPIFYPQKNLIVPYPNPSELLKIISNIFFSFQNLKRKFF